MSVLYIILSIIAVAMIALWLMVVISNEVQNEDPSDAFTPLWMTFIFFTIPYIVLLFLLKKFEFAQIPFWTSIPLTAAALFVALLSSVKALKSHLHEKEEFLKASRIRIDSEYKKRFEVVPNLVKVIKSYTENENKTIERVLQNREAMMKSYNEANRRNYDRSINVLLHSAYDYPALQSVPMYRTLNATLVNTQENIAYYTTEYNQKASAYNAVLKSFPVNILYKKFRISPVLYMDDDIVDSQRDATKLLKDL